VSEVTPCKITVQAKDSLGNAATKDFDCTIKSDDTPPTLKGLIPDVQRDGVPLYGYDTSIIIEFEDKDNTGGPGIGLLAKKAYLDMSDLGMGDFVQADACTKTSGANWQCKWLVNPSSTTPEGTYKIIVSEGTSDDLDNMLGTSQEYEIIYDNIGPKKPEILDFKVIAGESGVEYQGGAVRGDYLQYTVRSGEFISSYADFTEVGGDSETPPTTCTEVDNATSDCIYEALVDLSGPYKAHFNFVFLDDANNKATTNATLDIYGIDNETTAKYWKTPPTVTCSPRLIDRAAAAVLPPYGTCRIDLETPRKDITTLAIGGPSSPDQCAGDVALTLNDVYVVNNAEGSTHPYLFMKFEPKNYYVNDININCPLQVFSKRAVVVGNETQYYVSPYPQEVPANITFNLYNQPLGDLDKNIDEKIEKAFDKGLAGQEWITTLREILYWGELICTLNTILTSILSGLFVVTILLGGIADGLRATIFGAAAAQAVEQGKVTTCNVEEYGSEAYKEIKEIVDALCSVVNCAALGGKDAGIQQYIGGGVPWCKDIKEFVNKWGGGAILGGAGTESGLAQVNVKDSIVLSALCLCLPGIIYNLEKMRQIDCFQAVCLHDYVKESGYPAEFCDYMYAYFQCVFWMGQLFALLPFIKFFDAAIQIVLDLLTNPVALFTLVIGFVCKETCWAQGSTMFFVCGITKLVATVSEAIASWKAMKKSKQEFGKPPGTQYCDRMEEIEDEMGDD
jgi:hypothetical protein